MFIQNTLENALKEIGLEIFILFYKEVAQSKILAEEQETFGKKSNIMTRSWINLKL